MADPWEFHSSSNDLSNNQNSPNQRADFPLATFSQRALAWVVDIVLLAVFNEFILKISSSSSNGISAILDIAYFALLLGGPYGQTVGAKVAKIRVINLQGKPLGYMRAILRYLASTISAIIFGLGYLWMLKDKRNQTLHDKIAGSLVISLVPRPGFEIAPVSDNPKESY